MAILPDIPVPLDPIGAIGAVPAPPVPSALAAEPLPPVAPVPLVGPTPDGIPGTLAPPVPLLPLDAGRVEPPVPVLPVTVPRPTAPAPVPGEQRAEEAETMAADIEAKQQRMGELESELEDARQRFTAATTPEERAAIAEEAARIQEARALVQQDARQIERQAEEQAVQAAGARNVELARAQENALREQQTGLERINRDAEVAELERQRDVAKARERLQADRDTARKLLERGPVSTNFAGTMASAFAELVRASKAREVPNLSPIFDAAYQRDRQAFADEFERQQGMIEFTGDDLADLANQEREADAQKATAIATMLAETERNLAMQAASATTEEQRILAAQALPALRQQRAQAEAEAAIRREEAERKRRESEAAIRAKEAQARKYEAEAAKLERRGRGTGAKPVAAGLIAPNVVTLPDSDQPLVTLPDTPEGRKEAAATREIVGTASAALSAANEVRRLYDDAEKKGLLASAGWERTSEYSDLRVALEGLKVEMARIKADGFAPTEGDISWASEQIPGVPKAWTSKEKAMGDIEAWRNYIEDRSRSKLGSKTRLDKQSREKVIGAVRGRGISQREMRAREKTEAEKDLVAPGTSSARRVTALDQVEASAREEAKARGVEDDWLPLASAKVVRALEAPELRGDKKARAAALEKLEQYEKFAREREREATEKAHGAARSLAGAAVEDNPLLREAAAARKRADAIADITARARSKAALRDLPKEARSALRALPGTGEIVREIEAEEGTSGEQ